MNCLTSKYRTHTCGQLSKAQVGTAVVLSGWIHRKRDHGGVVFIDLRDNYGLTQVVFPGDLSKSAEGLRIESVIQISGKVVARAPELVNTKLATGEIEVQASELKLLAASEVLPFQIAEDDKAPEAIRLKSRFLAAPREVA